MPCGRKELAGSLVILELEDGSEGQEKEEEVTRHSHTLEHRGLRSQVWRAEEISGAGDLGIFQAHSLFPFKA